ncbi:Tetratricopeptide-like helical domain superfamily [Sesbania bispinosa]|nr:Tetratricopeptide-like helical domain superfamily [Sesbania bispinosa]
MEDKKKTMLPSPSHTKVRGFQSLVGPATNAAASSSFTASGKLYSPNDSESFYSKLTELLDSSGLSLIFNVRETLLDLHLFYLEVTRRGGYHQVGREKKWVEVVSALKLEGNNAKLSAQVEKLYAHLLYEFEKLYFYRCPQKQPAASTSKEQPVILPQVTKKPRNQETKKRPGAPGGRNAYHIFLKQECARLRTCNKASNGPKTLRMAVDAWKKMSEIEKQPYVEESKKNKEKFKKAMITSNKQQSMEKKGPSVCGGDYYVTSQPEADNSLVNKAAVNLALKMTEKDPLLLMDWDACCSLDFPTGEQDFCQKLDNIEKMSTTATNFPSGLKPGELSRELAPTSKLTQKTVLDILNNKCFNSLQHLRQAHAIILKTGHFQDHYVSGTLVKELREWEPDKAISCYHKMVLLNSRPNKFTYPTLLKACAITGSVKEGVQFHALVVKNGL